MKRQPKTTFELERLCFEALKGQSGFEHLIRIEVRPRDGIEGGANWMMLPRPRVETSALRSAKKVITALQKNYELKLHRSPPDRFDSPP